jgi:hypothetical protein
MVFIFIWAKKHSSTQVEFHQLSRGLRGMKEGGFFLHLRDVSKG